MSETEKIRYFTSPDYNYYFQKDTGLFMRWGKTINDDPDFCPFGPEILDLEISVNGCSNNCPFCYKNNKNTTATNMNFDTFKNIIDKVSKSGVLTQVAFGITGIKTNPDFIRMMEYCRQIGIVPNFTLSGFDLDDETALKCSRIVGAVAVSVYETDKNIGYNTIKKFTDLGVDQTNMHLMISQQTLPFVYEVLKDTKSDSRLSKLNCVVFLGVKPKGRARGKFSPLELEEFKNLISYCFQNSIPIGFDSCSAPKFESVIRDMGNLSNDQKKQMIQMSESCESFGLFSSYINVEGKYFCCSFCEGEKGWEYGLDVLNCKDFLQDVWYNPKIIEWRKKSLEGRKNGCRECLIFPEINT